MVKILECIIMECSHRILTNFAIQIWPIAFTIAHDNTGIIDRLVSQYMFMMASDSAVSERAPDTVVTGELLQRWPWQ